MNKSKVLNILAGIGIVALFVGVIVGLYFLNLPSEDDKPGEIKTDTGLTGGVAATVNGVEIEEDKITRVINNMRISYEKTDDESWKKYLKDVNYTVESLRYQVIGDFVDRELVLQCADKLGISTNDEEIQSYVDKMAEQYSSEEKWLKAVEDAGWENLDAYKDSLRHSILKKKIEDQYKAEVEAELADDSKMLEKINASKGGFTGAKRTSRIVISKDNKDLATEVYTKISNGELTFEDAVNQYSIIEGDKENGGDQGWDKVDAPTTEYSAAIKDLNIGGISEPKLDKYGYNIVTVTDFWEAGEGDIANLSDVPEEIRDQIKKNNVDSSSSTKYSDWVTSQRAENDVQVNPMPENAPYIVDMGYTEEEAAKINEKALNKLIKGVEEEETAANAAEIAAENATPEQAADAAAEADSDVAAGANDVTTTETPVEVKPEG